jgi:hypothetical protein
MTLSEMPSSRGFSSSSSNAGSIDCVEIVLAGGLALSRLAIGERGEEAVELVSVIFNAEMNGFVSLLIIGIVASVVLTDLIFPVL